ncbi:phospholipase [Motilibacter sp. K478]|nr:phospholipase [Motilibacter aurantiacus]
MDNSRHGRLAFRARPPVAQPARSGLLRLGDGGSGELALGWVPAAAAERPVRLVLLLHGAGGSARHGLDLLLPVAEERGLLLLAPKSRHATWDVIIGGYGPDVQRVDRLLDQVTDGYAVTGLTVAGFSDGASYALSLGIGNGDVFDSVVAFSPGFAAPLVRHGRPRVFVSHGTRDEVLPVDVCSRRLVPRLQGDGYAVTYHEFDGGHVVPGPVVDQAADWMDEPA